MGSTINPDGRLRVSSSISSIGTNRYRVSINLSVKSSLTWNEYGINCYAHIGSNKVLMGTFTVPQGTGVCKPSSYTHDFNVTANTEVYASCICTHCDGSDGWSAQSYADTATYTNPNTAPPTPTIKCLNYAAPGKYVLENTLDVELTQVTDPQGDTVRYVAYAQYKNSSGAWQSAGDSNNCILYSTTDRKVSINISQYARGTQFRIWGKAEDTKGASSALTGYIENIYRNQVPSTPSLSCLNTDIYGGNYIGENSVNLSLSSVSDPEGLSVSYRIYGQYLPPGGGWTSMGTDNLIAQSQSATIYINSYPRGTRFKFWGFAIDNFGAWSGQSNELNNVYRNQAPGTPIISCNNNDTYYDGRYVREDNISLSLSSVSDPEGGEVYYRIYGQYQQPGEDWKDIGNGTTLVTEAQHVTVNITNYARGTRFKFWGYTQDNFGAWSGESNVIDNIYRNRLPNTVSKIYPESKTIAENSINLSWSNPGDPDGQPLTYDIYISKNDSSFNWIQNTSSTEYSYNISSDPAYTKYVFKILTNDGMVHGYEKLSDEFRKDFPPYFLIPVNESSVYQDSPRIIAYSMDNNNIFLCVETGGVSFNTRDNSGYFTINVKPISGYKSVCFAASDIQPGGSDIVIYSSDGRFNSSRVHLKLYSKNISNNQNINDIVRYDKQNIINAINDLRHAYNIQDSSISNTNKDSIVRQSDLDIIRTAITNISAKINEYDSRKLNTSWNSSNIIRIDDIITIINGIKNI